jgi:histidine triad (HIT) family protein
MSGEKRMDCIFCKIVAGSIPSKKVFEDDRLYAFSDIDPKAPVHILLIPKNHIAALAHATAADREMLGHLLGAAADIASSQGLGNGYRVVINNGPDGGQTVDHLHLHLLGGRPMHWPPG